MNGAYLVTSQPKLDAKPTATLHHTERNHFAVVRLINDPGNLEVHLYDPAQARAIAAAFSRAAELLEESKPSNPAEILTCHYCRRPDRQLKRCCDRHPDDLVCVDVVGCRDYLLAQLDGEDHLPPDPLDSAASL